MKPIQCAINQTSHRLISRLVLPRETDQSAPNSSIGKSIQPNRASNSQITDIRLPSNQWRRRLIRYFLSSKILTVQNTKPYRIQKTPLPNFQIISNRSILSTIHSVWTLHIFIGDSMTQQALNIRSILTNSHWNYILFTILVQKHLSVQHWRIFRQSSMFWMQQFKAMTFINWALLA